MAGTDDERDRIAVRVKAVLIEPESMTVQWMNESAAHDSATPEVAAQEVTPLGTVQTADHARVAQGMPLIEAVPAAELLGLPDALRRVRETGVAEHLSTDLVSTVRGSVALVTSVYQLPDGQLLVLTENAWQPEPSGIQRVAKRSGRRTR